MEYTNGIFILRLCATTINLLVDRNFTFSKMCSINPVCTLSDMFLPLRGTNISDKIDLFQHIPGLMYISDKDFFCAGRDRTIYFDLLAPWLVLSIIDKNS